MLLSFQRPVSSQADRDLRINVTSAREVARIIFLVRP
jgi:hypothetical protein